MTIAKLLRNAQHCLLEAQALPEREVRIEVLILLSYVLGGVSRAWLIAHEQDVVAADAQAAFDHLMQRRLGGEPVAYILGVREFFGLEFNVSPAVLIPRPDTELLVELALECIPEVGSRAVLDLGTGSGAIAIAIAHQRPQAKVTAVDASAAALDVARGNANKLNTPNVRMLHGNWFTPVAGGKFDVIVSNPPYIAEADIHLSQGDLRFEPASALAAGRDGLDDIRQIVEVAPVHLNAGGWLMLEHGYDQAAAVADLLRTAGFVAVESRPDLAGILRVTLGKLV